MKALIICSVDALCDVSALERDAFNRACAVNGMPALLTSQDHARIVAQMTMLELLNDLPGSTGQRQSLIESYLEILNDMIWGVSIRARNSILSTLLDPEAYMRPTAFVAEYPTLTTNLIRSAALLTNATKLGHLTALSDPINVPGCTASLATAAASLNVAHHDVDVLVAHQRDFDAARSLGMQPRFVEDLRPVAKLKGRRHDPDAPMPAAAIVDSVPCSQPVPATA